MPLLCWVCCLLVLPIPQQALCWWVVMFFLFSHVLVWRRSNQLPGTQIERLQFFCALSVTVPSWGLSSLPAVKEFFLHEMTSFGPAMTGLPVGSAAFVRGDLDPISMLLLCWPSTSLPRLPAQDSAVRLGFISLITDFPLQPSGLHQRALTLLLGHLLSSHSTWAAADLLQNWILFQSRALLSPWWPWGQLSGAGTARATPGLAVC